MHKRSREMPVTPAAPLWSELCWAEKTEWNKTIRTAQFTYIYISQPWLSSHSQIKDGMKMKRHESVCDSEPTIDVYGGRIEFYRHHKSLPRDFFFKITCLLQLRVKKRRNRWQDVTANFTSPQGELNFFFFFYSDWWGRPPSSGYAALSSSAHWSLCYPRH